VAYLATSCLVFMLLFFAGTAPDVMKADGHNWVKPSWLEAAAHAESEADGHADHHEAAE
jgi:hypothetical protein